MAPYAVAHMKLGLQLAELGYKFDTEERLRVYLSNTLQEAFKIPSASDRFSNLFWGEADAANRIKEIAPVMVILGNPPYSGHSANNGDWIKNLLKGKDILTEQQTSNYFEIDGKPLGEKNPKWLNDDYVKFIRFAQWRIERTGYGVMAFVTNHSYLDNPTFRGMRQSLMKTFDDIYVLDLHGNSKKKERCPDGSKDENVFDIQQGVSINIFVKHLNGNKEKATVHHADLWGDRDRKYNWLGKNDITTTQWTTLQPQSQFYLFVPQDNDLKAEYEKGWKVTDIFPVNSVGIVTGQDKKTIGMTQEQTKFLADSHGLSEDIVKPILYRPFDRRFIVYDSKVVTRPRAAVMRHMVAGENLGISISRSVRGEPWRDALVSNKIIEFGVMATRPGNSAPLFPLYIYPNSESFQKEFLQNQREANFSSEFLNTVSEKIGYVPKPEAILYYIYAILYSPTYRDRYAEFLKIDFPRIPLTSNDELFRQLAEYGEQLVQLHLMTSPRLDNLITEFVEGEGDRTVNVGDAKTAYSKGTVKLNKKGDRFTGIPESVWNFYVGGYQPCQKWLKDRKERTLSDEDILHYQKIVVSLKETIEIMKKIDKAIPGFPIE
jgi:predicted helicase